MHGQQNIKFNVCKGKFSYEIWIKRPYAVVIPQPMPNCKYMVNEIYIYI
jgi:hypothetical protein